MANADRVTCPRCGAPLSADDPAPLCRRCLEGFQTAKVDSAPGSTLARTQLRVHPHRHAGEDNGAGWVTVSKDMRTH
jgi:predicted amidophosphoribosyltransferase